MGFSGGGGGVLTNHTHDTGVTNDGGALAANVTQFGLSNGSILFSDGNNIQELIAGSSAEVLAISGGIPAWITNTANPLIKVTKSYTDITALEMDIYTLPQDSALVNIWTDITTVFDISTAVTIGDAGDDNGFTEATDWTSGTGLTDATRGAYITSFQTMRSTSGTTAIKAYNFSSGGSTFTQASTNDQEQLNPAVTGRQQIGQLYQAGQILVGEDVSKASFFLKCATADATGTLTAFIRREDGTLVASSTTTLDATTITASYVEYTFDFPATTIAANDMIMVSAASLGTSNVDVATNSGANITNGIYMEEYNEVYRDAGKTASIKMTVTYNVTFDTQGAVDFYLQVVD
jgi:hypothetical protein